MTRVCARDALWIGELRVAHVEGRRVVLVRLEDGVRAYEDRCAHLGLPVSGGAFEDATLVCPYHGYRYDLRTGEGTNPRGVGLRRLVVVEAEDAICVRFDAPGAEEGSTP